MNTRKIAAVALILLVNRFGFADSSYQTTSQMTGGPMVEQLKSIPFLSKSMKGLTAPTSTITMVHGNQKAVVNKDTTVIYDLDKETIIHIDTLKKTYWLETFAEERQAVANMPKQLQKVQAQAQAQAQAQPQAMPTLPSNMKTTFDVSAKNTGLTKVINGLTAQQQMITMQMHVTNTDAPADQGNTITYYCTTESWIAPDPPAVKEIKDFDLRMAKKMMAGVDLSAMKSSLTSSLNSTGMSQMFGSHPGAAEALQQMAKEADKLTGTHVRDIVTLGGNTNGPVGSPATQDPTAGSPTGTAPTGDAATGSSPTGTTPVTADTSSGSTPAGQSSTGAATQTASTQSGKLGALGSVFGHSALGGWKKKTAPPPDSSTTPAADSTATPAGSQGAVSAVLMQTTAEQSNFSNEAIPPSVFQLPAGLTKVPSPLDAMNKLTP